VSRPSEELAPTAAVSGWTKNLGGAGEDRRSPRRVASGGGANVERDFQPRAPRGGGAAVPQTSVAEPGDLRLRDARPENRRIGRPMGCPSGLDQLLGKFVGAGRHHRGQSLGTNAELDAGRSWPGTGGAARLASWESLGTQGCGMTWMGHRDDESFWAIAGGKAGIAVTTRPTAPMNTGRLYRAGATAVPRVTGLNSLCDPLPGVPATNPRKEICSCDVIRSG